ncbi:MAG: MFS transporter [Anaerolineaceae bacterium]|nr:MFS transporter [Anaerolineaceae bacterium]
MKRALRWFDYITINIYWFALTTRSQVLTPLIVPLLVQRFVGDELKGTYLGGMRLWALMVALLVQALVGILSDRNRSKFGRRRPFIVVGTFLEVGVFLSIALIASMEGMKGYWILFGLYIISMISSNIAHGAMQGLIPDLVPLEKRGRFSGVKAWLELPVPLIFVAFVIAKMVSSGDLWGAIIALILVLLVCMLISLFVPEKQLEKQPPKLNWKPFLRLLAMTGVFITIIMMMGYLVKMGAQFTSQLSEMTIYWLTASFAVLGMFAAVLLGVWLSVSISLGGQNGKNKSFTWWVVNRLAFMVGSTNMAGFVIFFIQERFTEFSGEKAAGPASSVIMFVGIFILLTAIPSGWLADIFGKKKLIMVSGLLAAAGALIIISIPSLDAVRVGGCFVGAAVGLFYSASWALGTEIVPKEQAGKYLGIANLAGAGSGAIGAYIGGPIGDSLGYVLLMAIFGVMFFISIFALLGIKPVKVETA